MVGEDERSDNGQAARTAPKKNERRGERQVGVNRPGTLEESKGGGQEGAINSLTGSCDLQISSDFA